MVLATGASPPGVQHTPHTTNNKNIQNSSDDIRHSSDDEWQLVKPSKPSKPTKPKPKPKPAPRASPGGPSHTPCVHFAIGSCRNGPKCRFLHAQTLPVPKPIQIPRQPSPVQLPRQPSPIQLPRQPSPVQLPQIMPVQLPVLDIMPELQIKAQAIELATPEIAHKALLHSESPAVPIKINSWAHTKPVSATQNPALEHHWVFYEHRVLPKGGPASAYHHSMGWLGQCSTIGALWQLLNNVPNPGSFFSIPGERRRLAIGSRAVEGWSIFRHGVQPEWEDPKNCSGAELTVSTDSLQVCDRWWQDAVLAVSGASLPLEEEITGLRVIDKTKGTKALYRLELWFTARADPVQLKACLAELLTEPVDNFKLKQHSSQKQLQSTQDSAGRIKDVRALLAKLTPERFGRLSQQLRNLLGDGSEETVAAVVRCIEQCTMQTDIFHSMYAELVLALVSVRGVACAVTRKCLEQLQRRTESSRKEAKHAASFAAELCARGLLGCEELESVLGLREEPVDIEVICVLLNKLHPIKGAQPLIANKMKWLAELSVGLVPRLRFMVQDVLRM